MKLINYCFYGIICLVLLFGAANAFADDPKKAFGRAGDTIEGIEVPMSRVRAGESITLDLGGSIVEYAEKYNKARRADSKLRIEDWCLSACTMFFGLMPRENVCAGPNAILGFHTASLRGPFGEKSHSPEGTALLWATYPQDVRDFLKKEGWNGEYRQLEHSDMIYTPGTTFLKACD